MRKFIRFLAGGVLAVIVLAGIFLFTFDANKYLPQISTAISKQVGREVKLEGPAKLNLSWGRGIDLTVRGLSIANPEWASRPLMARVGKLSLGLALQSLFQNRIEITALDIIGADIQIESNAAGQKNWEWKTAENESQAKPTTIGTAKPEKRTVDFSIKRLDVTNSHFAMRGKDGKLTEIDIDNLALFPKGKGVELDFKGNVNGNTVALRLIGSRSMEDVIKTKWPFEAEARYNTYTIKANGILDYPDESAILDNYLLSAGNTRVTGKLAITYSGVRPAIQGTLNSKRFDPLDFKPEATPEAVKTSASEAKEGKDKSYIFSHKPFDFDGLKAIDAKMEISIGEIPLGLSALKQLKTKLDLINGRLLLSPFKTEIGGTQAEGQLKLDAQATPAQFSAMLKAYQIDLAQLVSLSGLKSFIQSKGDADMDIITYGSNMHEFASNSSGQLNLILAGGNVSQSVLSDIAGSLLNIFAPGAGKITKPDLNCAVAHFKIASGQMKSEGVLIDTGQATIAGTGGINLRDETIDMVLYARNKLVEEANIIAPPLRIHGQLNKPSYTPNVTGGAQKVASMILGGTSIGEGGVPEIIRQQGQNACEYTLKHPQAAKPASLSKPVEKAMEKAKEKVKDVGEKLLEGIGGMLGR